MTGAATFTPSPTLTIDVASDAGSWATAIAHTPRLAAHASDRQTDPFLAFLTALEFRGAGQDCFSLGRLLKSDWRVETLRLQQLLASGLRLIARDDREYLAIAEHHVGVTDIFAGTRWSNTVWRTVARRLPGAHAGTFRFGRAMLHNCVIIPLAAFHD